MALTLFHTYNRTMALISNFVSGTEKEALVKEVEELKTQLRRATEHSSELFADLELERNETSTLWDQIVYLNTELHREKSCRKMNTDLLQKERLKSDGQYRLIVGLRQQLEDMQSQLDEQTKKWLESEREINSRTTSYNKSFNELHTAYDAICESHKIQQQQLAAQKKQNELLAVKGKETQRKLEELNASHDNLQQRYDTDIKAEKQMNATLLEKVKMHLKSHARTVSEHKKQVQDMILEQNAYCQKVEHYKQSLHINLKSDNIDLKIQLHDQTLKNAELGAKLKAEEEANQVLRTENVRLMQELKDQVCQQEEVSSAVPQDPELVEEESLRVLQEPELVEEESIRVLQEPELVEEESLRVLQEPELVEEESLRVLQEPELVEEESLRVLQEPELVEEESLRVLQEPELVEEESICVLQEPELVEEESLRVLQEPELVEEESIHVFQGQDLWQWTSSALYMIQNLWMGPSALPMIPNIRRGYSMLYRSQKRLKSLRRRLSRKERGVLLEEEKKSISDT